MDSLSLILDVDAHPCLIRYPELLRPIALSLASCAADARFRPVRFTETDEKKFSLLSYDSKLSARSMMRGDARLISERLPREQLNHLP
jgi:hypothetical protein